MNRVKIITTDNKMPSWRSKRAKLREVVAALNTMENADFSIDVSYQRLTPEVVNGRVTHDFMDSLSAPLYREGYQFVGLHMSERQKRQLGIRPTTLRGVHHVDYDPVSEIIVWCDEDTKRGRFNQFIQTTLHELRHALRRGMGLPDDTHARHPSYADLRNDFAGMDMADFVDARRNYELQITALKRIIFFLGMAPTLYQAAVKYLGRDASPRDLAPDYVGCAESLCNVIRESVKDFPIVTGTWSLWQELESHPRFRRVTVPMPGTVIVAPTGTVTRAAIPGHAGIFGKANTIMSNTSATGLWEQNYTLDSWTARYGKAGYESYMYQLIS